MRDQELDAAYDDGFESGLDGLNWDDNPFNKENQPYHHEAWYMGWFNAQEAHNKY